MPTELMEASITTTSKSEVSIPTSELSPKAAIRRFLPDRVRDEYNNQDKVTILKPHPIIIEGRDELAKEFNKGLEEDFEYYSRTHDLEVNSERTKFIQENVIDRLAAGTGIDTRVVIMKKGRAPNAFVVPDGTIFISQSLINRLDSLDEIAAVLGHELGHLINRSSIVASGAGKGAFGVGWLHEEACDQKNAPELLEKAGFRTWAFGTAILKVQGYERGTIHQSGLARASQTVGGHMAIDRTTSNQSEIPIPKELFGEFSRTNLEIVIDKIEQRASIDDFLNGTSRQKLEGVKRAVESLIPLKSSLKQLHPKDLGAVYERVTKDRAYRLGSAMRACDEIISERLKSEGWSDTEVSILLYSLIEYPRTQDTYRFKSVEDLGKVVDIIAENDIQDTLAEASGKLIDSQRAGYSLPQDRLLRLMAKSIYDVNFETIKEGLPVTRDTLLDSLEKLSSIDNLPAMAAGTTTQAMSETLARYIERTFLTITREAKVELDPNQIRAFIQEIKDRGIKIEPSLLISYLEQNRRKNANLEIAVEAVKEVFELEKLFSTENIDNFFDLFMQDKNDREKSEILKTFLNQASNYFDSKNIPDEQRLVFAKYLSQKIDTASFSSQVPWLKALEDKEGTWEKADPEDQLSNDALMKFNLKLIVAMNFFKEDGEQFYTFLEDAMQQVSPQTQDLSKIQLINLCYGLLSDGQQIRDTFWMGRQGVDYYSYIFGNNTTTISNHERLLALPLIKAMLEKREALDFKDFGELNKYIDSDLSRIYTSFFSHNNKISLYGDTTLSLVTGREVRDAAINLLRQGVKEQDYQNLYEFLSKNYPAGPQKDQFLREINKHYLKSPDIAFDQKVEYMLEHFNQVGPEAMLILADQIQDIETYRYFRERVGERLTLYIEGDELIAVNVAAGVDLASSSLVQRYEVLLKTCQDDLIIGKQISTEAAEDWFRSIFSPEFNLIDAFKYDQNLKKMVLTEAGRTVFRTLADSFATLKSLPDLQKFAIAHKALTDSQGALTSPENRRKLSDLLIKALGMNKGFVAAVLSAACLEADAKLIGFPVSRMLMPLLFRGLDAKAVDVEKLDVGIWQDNEIVKLETLLSQEEIVTLIEADTRSISAFGTRYLNQPNSYAAQLAGESDGQFMITTSALNELLLSGETVPSTETNGETGISLATEAVIKGVETGGALGIRALQLASQFHNFPPNLERRLSETFDSNPGMNKLLFWENMNKLAIDESAKGNTDIEQFLQRVTLGDYLGGGSLQTTYAAILDAGTSNERQIIVKMKNPNVETFIKESYSSAHKTLDVVSKQGGDSARYARMGMQLIDLSQNWCLDDINDKTYVEDDEAFKQAVNSFNASGNLEVFYMPDKLFTSSKLKSETLASGVTVNQFLKDQRIDSSQKQRVVQALSRFFIHQIKNGPFVEESSGRKVRLIHSDPHVGNYMIDTTGMVPRVGVIDRSLYLKLQDEDLKVLEKLIVSGNDNEFVYGFVDRVLNINKVRGVQRAATTARVLGGVYVEYTKQRARGGIDRFALMRSMLTGLSDAKLDVPLNLRLMIRNIGAFQELGRRYGVDFEALYREAAA